MPRKGSQFAGLSVALVTPFRDGQVDYEALKQQVEFQIDAGTDCLCPVGTTGESPTLSHEEHERVISEVVEVSCGAREGDARHRLQQHGGSTAAHRWAAKEGADAALMVAPYYNKPTQEGFYQHYKAVAEEVDIADLRLQHPGPNRQEYRTRDDRSSGGTRNITMVKEATGSLDQASPSLSTTDLTVLSGDDSLTLPLLSVGRRGRHLGRGQHRAARHDRVGARPSPMAIAKPPPPGTTSCFRCAATCSLWPPIPSRSKPPCKCWDETPANYDSPCGRSRRRKKNNCKPPWKSMGWAVGGRGSGIRDQGGRDQGAGMQGAGSRGVGEQGVEEREQGAGSREQGVGSREQRSRE